VTGGAWLSSARVVRCLVKSNNERNPFPKLLTVRWELLGYCQCKLEEGGDEVKSSCPLHLGLQACYNGRYKELRHSDVKLISKVDPSPDWSLQLDSMKLESLVIPNQNVGVNTFPGVVHTARHAMGVCNAWSR